MYGTNAHVSWQELCSPGGKVTLEIELPEFPHAVIYQQAAVPSGLGPSPLLGTQSRSGSQGEATTAGSGLITLQVKLCACLFSPQCCSCMLSAGCFVLLGHCT